MKKELSINQRITLPLILPGQDTFEKLIIRKDVISKVKITQADIKKFKIKEEDKSVVWDGKIEAKAGPRKIDFTQVEYKYVKGVFAALKKDKKSKFNADIIELYMMFK